MGFLMVQQVTNDRGQSIWTYTPPHTARRQWWSRHRKRTMESPIQELGEGDPQHPWSKATGKAHRAPFPGSLSDLILTSDNVPLSTFPWPWLSPLRGVYSPIALHGHRGSGSWHVLLGTVLLFSLAKSNLLSNLAGFWYVSFFQVDPRAVITPQTLFQT